MNTAACGPSVAAVTGSDQNVGLPYMPYASSGPSGRARKRRAASRTDVTWASSTTPSAPTLRRLSSKLHPASTASTPMPSANWIRNSSAKWRCNQRRTPMPRMKAPKSGSVATTPNAIAAGPRAPALNPAVARLACATAHKRPPDRGRPRRLHAGDLDPGRVRLAEPAGAARLRADLRAGAAGQLDVRRHRDPRDVALALEPPARGHAAVDGDRRVAAQRQLQRLHLGRDDPLPVGVGEQRLVPVGEQAHGQGRRGGRKRPARQVVEQRAALVAVVDRRHSPPRLGEVALRDSGPGRDVA